MPRPGGILPPPQMAGNTSREFVEMTEATDQDENEFIDRYLADKLRPEYFWMDAGWYPNNGSWVNTGTWEVDPARFPQRAPGGERSCPRERDKNYPLV